MVKVGDDLDRIDKSILRELQKDGRMPNVELSRRVGLSATPCLERVKRLEKKGVIKGYAALVSPEKLQAALLVFVEIRLTRTSPDVFDDFKKSVIDLPQVLECHLAAYRNLLGETLLTLPGVSGSRTYVVMEEVKESRTIPIPG